MNNTELSPPSSIWMTEQDCSLQSFQSLVKDSIKTDDVPLASEVISNIPVYNGDALRHCLESETEERSQLANKSSRDYMQEWCTNFQSGSGVMVVRQGYSDLQVIDDVSDALLALINREEAASVHKGDHFAPGGSNSRLWNAHEKLAIENPELYLRYNSNPIIALISRSWLGPLYQMTAQVNLVRPGGQAQTCHRDYHLGFVSRKHLVEFPRVVHSLSAALTLQGAIAHCNMPIESGPTKILPFSQRYVPGYIAAQLPEFRTYFEDNCVQISLNKGDLLFFNPATFHAAGENKTSDIQRLVNLLQVGSGFGRSIETVDTTRICKTIYPALLKADTANNFNAAELESIIEASAEGYAFPTNLDLDSPTDSMIPMSQQEMLLQALKEKWTPEQFENALDAQTKRRLSF